MSLRIASLLPSATEMLYALGLGDRVIAVSHECDFPLETKSKPQATISLVDSRRSSAEIDADVKERLASGLSLYEIDQQLLRDLRPNIIVTQAQCDVCAIRLDDVRAFVASAPELAGCQIIALQPNSLSDVFRDIVTLGSATSCESQAERLVQSLSDRVAAVESAGRARIRQRGRARRVAIIEWTNPIMLAGNWTPELLEIAGGVCPLTPAGDHSRYFDWPEIQAFDPEAMVIAPCGFNLARSRIEAEELTRLPGWLETTATREGRVFAMDGNAYLNRSGPRLVDTVELLHRAIWHDDGGRFESDDCLCHLPSCRL